MLSIEVWNESPCTALEVAKYCSTSSTSLEMIVSSRRGARAHMHTCDSLFLYWIIFTSFVNCCIYTRTRTLCKQLR